MGLKWCGGFFKGIAAQLCRKRLAKGKPTEINLKDPFVEKISNQLSSFQWFLKSVSCKLWCRKNTDRKKCILSSVSPAGSLVTENGSAFLSFSSPDTQDTPYKRIIIFTHRYSGAFQINCFVKSYF